MDYSIELRNIGKIFDEKVVLRNLSFAVQPGKIIGYIGPNGAGKSTTIKLIMLNRARYGRNLYQW